MRHWAGPSWGDGLGWREGQAVRSRGRAWARAQPSSGSGESRPAALAGTDRKAEPQATGQGQGTQGTLTATPGEEENVIFCS